MDSEMYCCSPPLLATVSPVVRSTTAMLCVMPRAAADATEPSTACCSLSPATADAATADAATAGVATCTDAETASTTAIEVARNLFIALHDASSGRDGEIGAWSG